MVVRAVMAPPTREWRRGFSDSTSKPVPLSEKPTTRKSKLVKNAKLTRRTFFDKMRVKVIGGLGGKGVTSFEHKQNGCVGRPNGASGGRGGDVMFVTDPTMHSLDFDRYVIRGGNGNPGQSDGCVGAHGKTTICHIPIGTIVHQVLDRDPESGEVRTYPVADLDKAGTKIIVATGGEPGLGNISLKRGDTSNVAFSTTGRDGEERELVLELKLIADVSLVGYPNAGKSSLLCKISKATPEVACYPFTTLKPSVGMVVTDKEMFKTMSVCDIPGLIEGAHMNVGLGHDFLRHIERTKVLLYVLDMAGTEGRDPVQDFRALQHELYMYSEDLLQRRALIFCNKVDQRDAAYDRNMERLRQETDLHIVEGSALTNTNLDELVGTLWNMVKQSDKKAQKLVDRVDESELLKDLPDLAPHAKASERS
jgi:GTP-binding protein